MVNREWWLVRSVRDSIIARLLQTTIHHLRFTIYGFL